MLNRYNILLPKKKNHCLPRNLEEQGMKFFTL